MRCDGDGGNQRKGGIVQRPNAAGGVMLTLLISVLAQKAQVIAGQNSDHADIAINDRLAVRILKFPDRQVFGTGASLRGF